MTPRFPPKINEHRSCCQISSFRESGCTVVFPQDRKYWRCLSGTSYQTKHSPSGKLCDLLFFHLVPRSGLHAYAVELKGGGFSAPSVVAQLQAGASLIQELAPREVVAFKCILVHRKTNPLEHRVLLRARIKFGSMRQPIALIRCGAPLVSELLR